MTFDSDTALSPALTRTVYLVKLSDASLLNYKIVVTYGPGRQYRRNMVGFNKLLFR
jgi:hypothetical protein